MMQEQTYCEAAIISQLAQELPHWTYTAGCIQRQFNTSGWKSTLLVVNTIGHLAEAAWHHPEIVATYGHVIVKLQTHSAQGVTGKDFALAKKIEEVICWQPNDGILEGTPDDPRFKYLKYD